MKIGIDIDDVITDGETYYAYAQKYTAEVLKREPIIVNDLGECPSASYCDELLGWSEKEAEDFWKNNYAKVVSEARPRTCAKEVISQLRKDGHEIIIVTARTDKEMKFGFKWLEDNEIEYDKLYFDAEEKGKLAKELGIDIFIDDSFRNCKMIAEEGIEACIMDLRTNRNINLEGTGIKRIYSWSHFYKIIRDREELI